MARFLPLLVVLFLLAQSSTQAGGSPLSGSEAVGDRGAIATSADLETTRHPHVSTGSPGSLVGAAERSARAPVDDVRAETSPEGCVIERFTVFSPSMDRRIKAWAVLPPLYSEKNDARYPILYALHGRGAPHDTYAAMSRLRLALQTKPMIVVGFDADNASFYVDASRPQSISRDPADTTRAPSLFTTFFFDELLPVIETRYRVHSRQRMLTGFSMGGFGAVHYMLTKPALFCSVSTMSGVFFGLTPPPEKRAGQFAALLGDYAHAEPAYRSIDIPARIKQAADEAITLPPLLLHCGSEDVTSLATNRELRDLLREKGLRHEYQEAPGAHNWAYWHATAPTIIDFHWGTFPRLDPRH
jgi:enterochelin esterase-like enzyme